MAICEGEMQLHVLVLGNVGKTMPRLLFHTKSCGEIHEAVDNAVRVLRHGKHAFVLLRREPHSLALKPFIGVAVVKPLEQTLHQFVSARIGMFRVAYLSERVGKVAASAARNLHLGKHLLVLLEDGDVSRRAVAFSLDSGKITSRSTADDGDVEWLLLYNVVCHVVWVYASVFL